jgi:16S rRNA (cytosine967-C5)-methyltransferase
MRARIASRDGILSAEGSRAGAALRAAAARTLGAVVRRRQPPATALAEHSGADQRDAALLRALVFGCLRWHHRLQWQAAQLLTRPLAPGDAELAALLRVGLYQLQFLRIPDHAAVSATVDAAGLIGKSAAKGLINAVLRRFQRERAALDARMREDAEATFSHPRWLIDRLREDWGARADAILDANNAAPPMWLRVNVSRVDPGEYLARLHAAGIAATAAGQTPAAILLAEPQVAQTLPGFADGLVSVQDAAAQLAAGFLDLGPGQRVLDACAAPGNKAAHILESCPGVAELVAVDRNASRLDTVARSLGRLGLTATLVRGDATQPAAWWDGRPFDRILLDAPCSAIGVIRRHPDIKLLRRPDDVDRVVALQRALLHGLWPLLAPGGRLVYSTCTVLRRENELQIGQFLVAADAARPSGPNGSEDLQLFPGQANMDGFYYACVDKENVLRSAGVSTPQQ